MAAQSAIAPNGDIRLQFWNAFSAEVCRRVRDVNTVAEETVWIVSRPHAGRLELFRSGSEHCRVSCSAPLDRGIIIDDLVFPWSGCGVAIEGRDFTPTELASLVLDELAHSDENLL